MDEKGGWRQGLPRMTRRQSRGPTVGKSSNTGGSRRLGGHGGLEEHEGVCTNPLGSSLEDEEWGSEGCCRMEAGMEWGQHGA
jgi:hypothetical protein